MAHIGACRVYRIRQGELALLTRDHVHPDDPKLVMRALGASASDTDVEIHEVQHGDRFLMSSMTKLRDQDILEALSDGLRELSTARLLDVAFDVPHYACAVVDAYATPSLNALTRSAVWSGVVRSR